MYVHEPICRAVTQMQKMLVSSFHWKTKNCLTDRTLLFRDNFRLSPPLIPWLSKYTRNAGFLLPLRDHSCEQDFHFGIIFWYCFFNEMTTTLFKEIMFRANIQQHFSDATMWNVLLMDLWTQPEWAVWKEGGADRGQWLWRKFLGRVGTWKQMPNQRIGSRGRNE